MYLTYFLTIDGLISYVTRSDTPGGCLRASLEALAKLKAYEAIVGRPPELDIVALTPEQTAVEEERYRIAVEESFR